ncbi:MAG: 2-oxoacid:acceptor oxidoreductase family protein [Bacillota bacterium]|nr:2-oxoacid:acceptor oxidoreductase family protein [Bacillota bacterium]
MERTLIVAGFGGQGVLSLGMVIARAGMSEGYEVSWLPSYGPEQRGGTANCHVILSDEPVACPLVGHPQTLIAFNLPSLEKFAQRVVPGGEILVESGLEAAVTREDVRLYALPALEEANRFGDTRVANMVMLGAWLELHPILGDEAIEDALRRVISKRHHDLLPLDLEAIRAGRRLMAMARA